MHAWLIDAEVLAVLSNASDNTFWTKTASINYYFLYIVIHGLQLPLVGMTTRMVCPSLE